MNVGPRAVLAKRKFDAKDYAAALKLVEQLLVKHPGNPWLLRLAIDIQSKTGELSQALVFANRLVDVDQSAKTSTSRRKLEGRLRETDPRWGASVSADQPQLMGQSILYVAKESRPFHDNGFCTRTHETLASLRDHNVDIRCVTMPGFPANIGVKVPQHESVVGQVSYRHLLPNAGALVRDMPFDEYVQLSAQLLAREVADGQVGLLHVGSGHRGYETALAASAVARWAGIPWLYEVRSFFENTWSPDPRFNESSEYYHRRLHTETRMMNEADAVVTISGPMRDEIVNVHRVDPGKVTVIPNSVDIRRFQPQPKSAELVQELRLASSFVVGYISNLSHPREGQEVLIRAVAECRRRGDDVTGLLVGDGGRRSELENLARREGVTDHVRFTGNVPFDDIANYYALIDLFVVPRVDERAARLVSPIKPFEAMAMRVPVLTSDLPALAEIVGAGSRGRTFKTGDHHDLALQIKGRRANPDSRRLLADRAYEWVREERDWASTARAFSHLYEAIMQPQKVQS